MTIDVFDWLHRTGADPPHEPVPATNCTSAPARPFLYEGIFAHEYQHLLEYYEDPEEVSWVNEGLSDYASDADRLRRPKRPVRRDRLRQPSAVLHRATWVTQTDGEPEPGEGGPENSLTLWGDQGARR